MTPARRGKRRTRSIEVPISVRDLRELEREVRPYGGSVQELARHALKRYANHLRNVRAVRDSVPDPMAALRPPEEGGDEEGRPGQYL